MKQVLLLLALFGILQQDAASQTGIAVPSMSKVDNDVTAFMGSYGINGGAVAITKDGRLVYNRGFGFADAASKDTVYPHTRFRIASVSKPITAIAIMKLVEDGVLSLDEYVFNPRGFILGDTFYRNAIAPKDSAIFLITVRHLLEHSAGWDRSVSGDPIDIPLTVAAATGTGFPAGDSAMIRYLLQKGLDNPPGTVYAYSNIGYLILGKIIEARTGMKYERYLDSVIFGPLGLCDMSLAKNLLADKQERESEYHNSGANVLSCYNTGAFVPAQYGGLNIEAMNAHGGWIATAAELTRLIVAVDGFSTVPDILSSATIDTMVKPSSTFANYAKGWSVNASKNWWHTGSLPGTGTFICRTSGGVTWAFLFNERKGGNYFADLDDLPWDALAGVTYPTHDLFPPEKNVSNLVVSVSGTSATINWINGSGNRRIVAVAENPTYTAFPADGMSYAANTVFGNGQTLGTNTYVVLNDSTSTSITVTGLNPANKYRFTAFEYTTLKTGGLPVYKIGCHPQITMNMSGVGVTGIAHQNKSTVLPNPAYESCTLVTDKSLLNCRASLTDITGRILKQFQVTENRQGIDLRTLAAGMYIIHMSNGEVLRLFKH